LFRHINFTLKFIQRHIKNRLNDEYILHDFFPNMLVHSLKIEDEVTIGHRTVPNRTEQEEKY